MSFEERLVRFLVVNERTNCWEWTGWKNNKGYGQIGVGRKLLYSHRAAWLTWVSDIDAGLCVLHRCDNAVCCNPDHLFLGTVADNNADCLAKGRHVSGFRITRPNPRPMPGELHANHKLTDETVRQARYAYDNKASIASLARRFKVSETLIRNVVKRRTWKHI